MLYGVTLRQQKHAHAFAKLEQLRERVRVIGSAAVNQPSAPITPPDASREMFIYSPLQYDHKMSIIWT